MFRRSLLLFFGLCLFGLALTVGYALTGLSGPESAMREAEQAMRLGQYAEAVRLLDTAEGGAGLQSRPQLHARLLELRYRANRTLNNHRRALADLEARLALEPGAPSDLVMDHVVLLLMLDQAERADRAIRDFLAENPDDPRALELAGEARQTRYREKLGRVGADLRRDLGPADESTGVRAMFSYLFRPGGDPGVQSAIRTLAELYSADARLALAWPQLRDTLIDLRPEIQRGLEMYRLSLERGGQPVAAYVRLADALEQAGRIDDQIALSEIYLRNYDHLYAQEAASRLADSHLAAERYRAVIEISRRFLPGDTWREKLEQKRLDGTIEPMLLAHARALEALDDAQGMRHLRQRLEEMTQALLPVRIAIHYLAGVLLQRNESWDTAERNLAIVARHYAVQAPPRDGVDPLVEVMNRQLAIARGRDAPPGDFDLLFEQWMKAAGRGEDATAYAARARYHFTTGRFRTAYTDAQEALRRAPNDEPLLILLAQTADAFLKESGRDGETLLAHCIRQRIEVPRDLPHPVSLLNVAEAALRAGRLGIARECARRAVDKFTWARWPRMLEVRAVQQAGKPEEAVALLERMRRFHADDAEALVALRDARRVAGMATDDLLFDMLRTAPPDANTAAALLRRMLAHGGSPRLRAMAQRVDARVPETPELLGLLCRAWLECNEPKRAAEALSRAGDRVAGNGELAAAAAELLVALAELREQELNSRAREMLGRFRFAGPQGAAELFDAAVELAAADRPGTAYLLLEQLLDQEDPDFPRGGTHYLLAGELALRLGWDLQARDHWTAAIGFRDGAAAAEPLAVLLLVADEDTRARRVLEAHAARAGPALALRLGDAESALTAAEARLRDAPSDLIALAIRSLAGGTHDPRLGDGTESLDPADRRALADALMLVERAFLPAESLSRLTALQERHPGLRLLDLLRARALMQAGQVDQGRDVHAALAAERQPDVLLVTEAVHAAKNHGQYRLPPVLWARLQNLPYDPEIVMPKPLAAFLAQSLAHEAVRKDRQDLALDLLARLWREMPLAAGASVREAEVLYRGGRLQEALALMYVLEPTIEQGARGEYLDSLFTLAAAVAGIDPKAAQPARTTAMKEVAAGRARGTAVHLLVQELEREFGDLARVPESRAIEILHTHIAAWRSGVDPNIGLLQSTIQHLAVLEGTEAGLKICEQVLRHDPSLFDVWVLRARLLAADQRAEQAVDELRRLAVHLDDRAVALTRAELAARHGVDHSEDLAYLEASCAGARDARYRFARGLLALRVADYALAEELLAQAAPTEDGAHVYFRALANLSLPGREAAERARDLFTRLEADYESSSLARYAGSFARQLSR